VSSVTREHGTVVIAGLHHQPAVLDLHASPSPSNA
jgi:hypothetical protein